MCEMKQIMSSKEYSPLSRLLPRGFDGDCYRFRVTFLSLRHWFGWGWAVADLKWTRWHISGPWKVTIGKMSSRKLIKLLLFRRRPCKAFEQVFLQSFRG